MDFYLNGNRIAVEDRGQGQPIMLLHAFPLAGALWAAQMAALVPNYRVIVPDLRGFGLSDAPPGPYTMESIAHDLSVILDAFGLKQVILGGLSMGGYVSLALLRQNPARIRSLILADTRATPDSTAARAGREVHAQLVETQGVAALADKVIPGLLAPNAAPETQARVRALIERNSPTGIAGALRGMALRSDSSDLLPQISVPTLVIVGAEDSLTPPAEVYAMHQAIPNSQFVTIPNAGHLTCLEQPAAFTAAVTAFLGGV